MSSKDRDRLKVLHGVKERHITQVQAGKELGVSARWVRELLRRMKTRGDRAVVHDSCNSLETGLKDGIELVKHGNDILGQAFPFTLLE